MRTAVLGGSFDPPHIGHAQIVAWLLWTQQVDQVWLLPAFAHPFGKQSAPFEQRVALCEALARTVDASRIRVMRTEQDLPTPSYTIDTLDHLASLHPEHTLRWVMGADVLPDVSRWKDWAGIERRYAPIVVGRMGQISPPDSVVFPEVSSSEIRRRLACGERVDHLVPAEVLRLLRG